MILNILLILMLFLIVALQAKDTFSLKVYTTKTLANSIYIVIACILMLLIDYLYAKILFHHIALFAVLIHFILSTLRNGLSSKGLNYYAGRARGKVNWDRISSVTIYNADSLKLVFDTNSTLGSVTQTYKKEHYSKILNLLKENLPKKAINIK